MLVKPIPSPLPAEKQGGEPDSDFIVFPTPANHAGAGCTASGPPPATSQPRWDVAGAIDTARPGGYPLAPRFEHTMTDRSVAPTITPPRRRTFIAQVAELVDAQVSGTCGRKAVEVRVFSWAPIRSMERTA